MALVVAFLLWRVARLAAERRELEARVRQATVVVREAERLASAGRVAAGIAHEVGNPLSAIANYAHVLMSRSDASAEVTAAFAALNREIERIDGIVTGVLDFARPAETLVTRVSLTSVLRQSVRLLSEQGVLRRVQVREDIAAEPLDVLANAHELQQAFVNLLLNAADAVGGAGPVSVHASRTTPAQLLVAQRPPPPLPGEPSYPRPPQPRRDRWLAVQHPGLPTARIVVADAGNGVQDAVRDRIFDPFYTTKRSDGGSGLGLAIVQRVIDTLSGVIWAQSSREGGAAFHILVPLAATSAAPTTE